MLRDLHGYRQDNFKVFRHCQRILEKLGVHETLISIVDYADRPAYRELVATIYTFYH